MFGLAFADVALVWLRKWGWAIALLALAGFQIAFYFWAYERGESAERMRHVEAMIEISNEAYDLVTGFQADIADLDADIRRERARAGAAAAKMRTERDSHYAANPADDRLCLTPARVSVLEAGLAALAGPAAGDAGGQGGVPAVRETGGQDTRGPAF